MREGCNSRVRSAVLFIDAIYPHIAGPLFRTRVHLDYHLKSSSNFAKRRRPLQVVHMMLRLWVGVASGW